MLNDWTIFISMSLLWHVPIIVLLLLTFTTPVDYYFKFTHELLLYTCYILCCFHCYARYALYVRYRGMLEEQIFALRKTSETRLESLKKEAVMVSTFARTICAYTYCTQTYRLALDYSYNDNDIYCATWKVSSFDLNKILYVLCIDVFLCHARQWVNHATSP